MDHVYRSLQIVSEIVIVDFFSLHHLNLLFYIFFANCNYNSFILNFQTDDPVILSGLKVIRADEIEIEQVEWGAGAYVRASSRVG